MIFIKKEYDLVMFVIEYLNWDMVKCDNENEMKHIDEIHEKVYSLVKVKNK